METHFEVLGDLTDETLEGELADEQLGGLLVATDFTEGDGSGAEAMGLLHTTGGGLQHKKSGKGQHVCAAHVGRARRRTAVAVLRAALVASCLRGALPVVERHDEHEKPEVAGRSRRQRTSGGLAGCLLATTTAR